MCRQLEQGSRHRCWLLAWYECLNLPKTRVVGSAYVSTAADSMLDLPASRKFKVWAEAPGRLWISHLHHPLAENVAIVVPLLLLYLLLPLKVVISRSGSKKLSLSRKLVKPFYLTLQGNSFSLLCF